MKQFRVTWGDDGKERLLEALLKVVNQTGYKKWDMVLQILKEQQHRGKKITNLDKLKKTNPLESQFRACVTAYNNKIKEWLL